MIAALVAQPVGAQGAARPALNAPATPQAFADVVVRTTRTHDIAGRERLFHPAVLACTSGENRSFLDRTVVLEQQSAARDTGAYRVSVRDLTGPVPLLGLPDSLFWYPVPPIKQLQIDYDPNSNRGTIGVLLLARSGAGWLEVIPCPKPGAGARARAWIAAQEARGRAQHAQADSLARALTDPLRSAVLGLVRQGKELEAAKRYGAATGRDLTTSWLVVQALQGVR